MYNYCRGIDHTKLENKEIKSVGAEINWGVRFQTELEFNDFIKELSQEVYDRLTLSKIIPSTLTLTLKRRDYVGEPSKYLGHGHCTDFSKTANCVNITSPDYIFEKSIKLLKELSIPIIDIRGIGIHLKTSDRSESNQPILNFSNQRNVPKNSALNDFLPSNSQIDPEVLQQLPKRIQADYRVIEHKKPIIKSKIPNLCGCTDYDLNIKYIQEWMTGKMLPQDISYVNDYLNQLVEDYDMNKVLYILKILKGTSVFNGIFNTQSEFIFRLYGSRLSLKSIDLFNNFIK